MIGLILWTLGTTAILVAAGWAHGPLGLWVSGLIYVVAGIVLLRNRMPFR